MQIDEAKKLIEQQGLSFKLIEKEKDIVELAEWVSRMIIINRRLA